MSAGWISISNCTWSSFPPNSIKLQRQLSRIPENTFSAYERIFSGEQKHRLSLQEIRRKRYQRQMARREKGSNRQKRTAQKAASCHAYAANVRHDLAHKASRKIVDSEAEVFVFEDLKVKNMTKAPKPRKSGSGKNLPNGAAAKQALINPFSNQLGAR